MNDLKQLIAVAVMVVFGMTYNASAQSKKVVSEEEYISACLFNFSRYIQWPEEYSTGEFSIAVIGDKKLYEVMEQKFAGKKTGMQKVKVKYFPKISDVTDFNHIVFVSSWQSQEIKKTSNASWLENTLLVTQNDGMTAYGAAINFIIHGGYIKFEICRKNVTDNGLKLSSRLEQLAARTI